MKIFSFKSHEQRGRMNQKRCLQFQVHWLMQVHGMRSPGGQIEEFQLCSPALAEDIVCII